jgi:hypothetical protein
VSGEILDLHRRPPEWWPLDPFSYGGSARIATATLDGWVGGEVVEHWGDGTSRPWALPAGSAHPCVDLEHRGWERLTTQQREAACALPGGYAGGAFDRGWSIILTALKEHLT